MILVRYHEIGAYRLYHPLNHSIVVSRYVKVCEIEAWDWNKKAKSSKQTISALVEEYRVQQETNTQDEVPIVYNQTTGVSRIQRFVSTRLDGHEITPYNEVNEEVEFVHFALSAYSEPINYEIEMTEKVWKNAMIEELNAINRNNTWELTN